MRLSVWRAVGVPRCLPCFLVFRTRYRLVSGNVREVDGDPGAGRARPRVRVGGLRVGGARR